MKRWIAKAALCIRKKDSAAKSSRKSHIWSIAQLESARNVRLDSLEDQVFELESVRNDVHKSVYATLLQSCGNAKLLQLGRRVHALIVKRWLDKDVFLANHLINMYSRCGDLHYAATIFEQFTCKNLFSWNIMITACVRNLDFHKGLHFFRRMDSEGMKPSVVTFVAVVGACSGIGDLSEARRIHSRISAEVREITVVLNTALITMYGKCSGLEDARLVFNQMQERNDVSWNAMIGAYAQQGEGHAALELFDKMLEKNFEPSEVTYVSVLDACASVGDLYRGRNIHIRIRNPSEIVSTALLNMYSKCGSIPEARRVFDTMQIQDVVSWTAMVVAYTQNEDAREALRIFWRMVLEGVKPDKVVFVSLLDACSLLGDLRQGKEIHELILHCGFDRDGAISSGLVNMYRKCGSLTDAKRLFSIAQLCPKIDDTTDRLTWNPMISGYVELESSENALLTYRFMNLQGVKPDSVTFNSILGAFTSMRYLTEGKAVHARCLQCGIHVDLVGVSLVKMYGQCGSLEDAKYVFDDMHGKDVVAWSALIGAYAQHGHGMEALGLFDLMEADGVVANDITFIALLDACASEGELRRGKEIHEKVVAARFDSQVFVATALVNMYGKCGELSEARYLFDNIHPRDIIAFTAMITAYVLHGHHWEALELYFQLEPEGMKPDKIAYLSVLEACASLPALEKGKLIHNSIINSGLSSDTGLRNALINLYGKCGAVKDATELFHDMNSRDLVTWNTMIMTYARHGHEETALEMFRCMKLDGVLPNDVTFVSVLFVCSHAGLFEEGCRWFGSIAKDFFMELTLDQYGCIIDLLGRAGNLEEAEKLIEGISEPCTVAWMTLLGACRIHGDADRAARIAKRVAEMDHHARFAGKVLLSNIYAESGMWQEASLVRFG